jgi:hypothetical protein
MRLLYSLSLIKKPVTKTHPTVANDYTKNSINAFHCKLDNSIKGARLSRNKLARALGSLKSHAQA